MNRELIETEIKKYIIQSIAGGSQENPKLDFKTKWHNLKDIEGLAKFLKITSAIANTPGENGFIVYGYNDTNKTFERARVSDSGLRDSNLITGIINKNIQRAFDLNVWDTVMIDNELSIIHIPPSIDKPHVIPSYKTKDIKGNIREEKEKTFIRKGTNTVEANRFDLDFMYYDRKNIFPEYELYLSIRKISKFTKFDKGALVILDITFENTGRRPVSIDEIQISILLPNSTIPIKFKSYDGLKENVIVLMSNTLMLSRVNISSDHDYPEFQWDSLISSLNYYNFHLDAEITIICKTTTGKYINAKVDHLSL